MTEPLYKQRPLDLPTASMPEALRINDFIYASHGSSNTFMVRTSQGRVIVNTGMGFEAPLHKRNFDAVDSSPTRYILLTRAHVDHVGGVDCFREEGTEIVAEAGNQQYQDEDHRLRAARSNRSLFAFRDVIARARKQGRGSSGPAVTQSRPAPTLTFEKRHDFELGGLRFELIAIPGAETTESMVVWLPEHEILFTGNLFGALWGHIPNLVTVRGDRYRDALVVIEAIDRVLALEPEIVLYGHHAVIEGKALICEELTRLRGAVEYVHDRTVEYMNAGVDVWTAMREMRLPPELDLGEGYGTVAWDVRAIWETYLGWFHQQSTTELFATPARSVHADLVELAGTDAIAERAREKLAAGAPVEAIHLAEIALGGEPDDRAALEVSLRAHEVLAKDATNFWLSAWLRDQIEQLRRRLDHEGDAK